QRAQRHHLRLRKSSDSAAPVLPGAPPAVAVWRLHRGASADGRQTADAAIRKRNSRRPAPTTAGPDCAATRSTRPAAVPCRAPLRAPATDAASATAPHFHRRRRPRRGPYVPPAAAELRPPAPLPTISAMA